MEQRIVVYPYKMSSEAGIAISKALNALRVYPDGAYKPRKTDIIFNWGNGTIPNWKSDICHFINPPEAVMTSINKLKSYRKFRAAKVNIPLYTSDAELAAQWIEQGHAVVCRARLEGKDGEGIVVAKKGEHELEPSKLYCQFIPNKREFRAYVWQGEVFEVIEKKRKDLKNYDKYIRSSSRGWVHCKDPTNVPSGILPVAAAATKAIGLDFAGVDLITTDTEAYVLEVNTAPGIYGTTVTMLRDRVLKYAKEMQNAM